MHVESRDPSPPGPAGPDVEAEIDAVVAEHHGRTPRDGCVMIGAAYARFSTSQQDSVADQVRAVLAHASTLGAHVPRENVFFDQAVRGCRDRRPGLDRLRASLERRGSFDVLIVLSTSRLYRKAYKAFQFVEEQVVERGRRCVFPAQGVDTADERRWRLLLQANSITDEVAVASASHHIRAAQEGCFDRGEVFGTFPYGYRAAAIEGPPGRKGRPRRAYEIDPEAAAVVRGAFDAFVRDRLSIAELARRLNGDPRAPRNPRLGPAGWTHPSVRRLLSNPRYRGLWAYGEFRTVWQSRKDYARPVRRDAPLRQAQLERLRVVDDETWHAARRRLGEGCWRGAGRKPRDGDRRSRPRALDGLFFCGEHGRRMYVGGGHGRMLICPACRALPRATRPLCSLLRRSLALERTCARLAGLVAEGGMAQAVVEAARREAAALQAPDPARVAELSAAAAALTRRIDFILGDPGEDDRDLREARAKLAELRRARAAAEEELARLRSARPLEVPDEAEARAMLDRLGATLEEAARGEGDAAREARAAVDALTGGRVDLFQMGGRQAKRGWLQGRFALRLPGRPTGAADPRDGAEVLIDFRQPAPFEVHADAVKRLYDEGLLVKEIARRLGVGRNAAAKALAWWHERRGLEPPDGRSRRWTLAPDRTSLEPALFVRIADEALRLCDEGLLFDEVAARLGCDRNTAAKAARHAAASRGRSIPDGRTRRKELGRYSGRPARPKPDAGS